MMHPRAEFATHTHASRPSSQWISTRFPAARHPSTRLTAAGRAASIAPRRFFDDSIGQCAYRGASRGARACCFRPQFSTQTSSAGPKAPGGAPAPKAPSAMPQSCTQTAPPASGGRPSPAASSAAPGAPSAGSPRCRATTRQMAASQPAGPLANSSRLCCQNSSGVSPSAQLS